MLAADEGGVRRRDFLNIAAVSFAGMGGAVLLYPLLNQMNQSADVLALAQIDVDIGAIRPGQAIKTIWRKQPIFIRNLTPAERRELGELALRARDEVGELALWARDELRELAGDPESRRLGQLVAKALTDSSA